MSSKLSTGPVGAESSPPRPGAAPHASRTASAVAKHFTPTSSVYREATRETMCALVGLVWAASTLMLAEGANDLLHCSSCLDGKLGHRHPGRSLTRDLQFIGDSRERHTKFAGDMNG